MSIYRTDDPIADYDRYLDEQDRQIAKLPVCIYCDHPIRDEKYYDINGECMCQSCLNEHHRKWVDEYVE